MMRLTINRNIDEKRMFAVWRIPSPWKPKTKQSLGKRMGGGKGTYLHYISLTSCFIIADIHHYVTPIRANRMIVEVGGHLDWKEANRLLSRVASLLPFHARFVSQDLLDTEKNIEDYIAEHNVNPFYPPSEPMLKNYAGSRTFLSPWHLDWADPNYR